MGGRRARTITRLSWDLHVYDIAKSAKGRDESGFVDLVADATWWAVAKVSMVG